MTPALQNLIIHLRINDWNLRAPQEMADMIADSLEKLDQSPAALAGEREADVSDAMIDAAMPWLAHVQHMRATDKRNAVQEAIRAALASRPTTQAPAEPARAPMTIAQLNDLICDYWDGKATGIPELLQETARRALAPPTPVEVPGDSSFVHTTERAGQFPDAADVDRAKGSGR